MKNLFFALVFALSYASEADALALMNKTNIKHAQEYGIMRYQEDIPDFAKPWCVYEETSKVLDLSGERVYIYTPYYLVALNARERLISSQTINIVDGEMIVQEFSDILPVCVVLYIENADRLENKISAFIRQGEKTADAYEVEVQDTVVVQTKVVREREKEASADKKTKTDVSRQVNETTDKKDQEKPEKGKPYQDGVDKDKEKTADKKNKENAIDRENKENVIAGAKPEAVFAEKIVPLLYRAQLFFYFDMRQIKLSGPAVLTVNVPRERERRFNLNFNSIN
ncbi:MAG: hypothetical protein LBP78_08850 [Acidaminococcales bacterium]|jgi:hypothetical protein|nr:hypothetical protein [Acidaminococcales bacterium]